MPNSNSVEQIRERREKISILLSRGYNQSDIMKELGITAMTYSRDMRNINEMNSKQFYDLAKSNPSDTFLDCINDLDKITKECWKIYNDPKITPNDKILALKTISEINDRKYSMFQEGSDMLRDYHDHDYT